MKPKYYYSAIVVLFLLVVGTRPALGTRHIPTDTCIGTWDSVNRIYTLTTDVDETLYIDEDDLTLDGAGHAVAGSGVGNGIEAHGRSGVVIKNVNVTGWQRGVYVWDGTDISLKHLTCESNDGAGLSLWLCRDCVVKSCTLESNSGSGVDVLLGDRLEISDNKCSSNGSGIYGYFTDSKLTNNTCIENYGTGIGVDGDGIEVSGNECSYNNGTGIGVCGARIEVSRNECSYNRNGISGYDFHGRVTNNTCIENDGYGIRVDYGGGVEICGNNCSHNNAGIQALSLAGCRVADNTCIENSRYGIQVDFTYGIQISGNECSCNGGGISLFDFGHCKLANNTCLENDGSGISISWGGGIELSGNNCSYNNCGIVCSGQVVYYYCRDVTVTDNSLKGNSCAGVYLSGCSDITMAQNDLTENGMGVKIEYYCSNIVVSHNSFRGNATQASVKDSIDVIFDCNYWDDYTGQDLDGDGFGETPYLFPGGQDDHPRVYKEPVADADGPYEGVVGQPIVFDASGSYDPDGDIEWYGWVWGPDGEGSAGRQPICEHTWYSRFSGTVMLVVIDDQSLSDTDTAWVEVTGPERTMVIDLESHADLHVYDPAGRHMGINYETNTVEQSIPGASFKLLNEDGDEVPYDGSTPAEGLHQAANLPVLAVGGYRILLIGTSDGCYEVAINGLQDGEVLCCKTYEGQICEGECMTTNAIAGVADGALTLEFEPLVCLPSLCVQPEELKLTAESNSVQEVVLVVSEMMGKATLHSVTVQCTDLVGRNITIDGSDIAFDIAEFDVAPGGQQVVHAYIPVPWGFREKVTGSIVVESGDGGTELIELTVKPAKSWPLVVEPGGPYEGAVGQPITFDASDSYNPDGEIIWYGWDFDGDGTYRCTHQPVCEHTWDAPFSGTVTLVVTDDQSRGSAATTTVVVRPDP